MPHCYDTIIAGGRVVDGTGGASRIADVGVRGGRIAAVGNLSKASATEWIDAKGQIVAPGHVGTHAHYDVALFWDPYCSNSGENGVTTVLNANCGFGIAPVRPKDRARTMLMMANTEQIPVMHQETALSWDWEDFPSFLEHLRSLPKGINILTFLPINPLLIYVMGIDGAKSRRPTAAEMLEMHRLINEAMDAGAAGISMSVMGVEGNNHLDFDGSPMPTDAMDDDVAVEIGRALADRGEGLIQMLSHIVSWGDRTRSEKMAEMAKGSGARVIHNIMMTVDSVPGIVAKDVAWMEAQRAAGRDITAGSLINRGWVESGIQNLDTVIGQLPAIREIVACDGDDAILELLKDPDFAKRLSRDYAEMGDTTGSAGFGGQVVLSVGDDPELQRFVGQQISEVAETMGLGHAEAIVELGVRSGLALILKSPPICGCDPKEAVKLLSDPGIMAGGSDGGAHSKTFSLGQWATDLLIWLVREEKAISLEAMHFQLALKPALSLDICDRGAILPGFAADILIYDLNELYYDMEKLEIAYDMPNGDWRRKAKAGGYRRILVNGVTTHIKDVPTSATPGDLIGRYQRSDAAVMELEVKESVNVG